jgi:hypothetical protein
VGTGPKNLIAFVYNDSGGTTGATVELLAAGYKCPGTTCGTLAPNGSPTSGTTGAGMGTTGIAVTITPLTYVPPTVMPNAPYDRPMILAVSKADNTKLAQTNFVVGQNIVFGPFIGFSSRLSTILTGGSAITITAGFGGDTGVNKTAIWTLTDANGAACQPTCGTLGTPAYAWNGINITATVPYTPPTTVPAGAAAQPVLTMATADVINGVQQTDAFQFKIIDGTCGTGNESLLNGPYAFLMQGGSATQGYGVFIGSFTANGTGGITAGSLDINRTVGPVTGLSINPTGSSYSLGSDRRGCLTLVNTTGAIATYRIAVGTLDGSNHATKGNIIRFDDNTGSGQRLQGILMKQVSTSVTSGSYAFGEQGVTSSGTHIAVAGVYTSDGAGHLTNFNTDAADESGNVDTNDPGGFGTYSAVDTTTGRGTTTVTNISTNNSVFYVVNSSEFLSMTTDAMGLTTPIISGDNRKQTGSFTPNSLDNKNYAFSSQGVETSNGGNSIGVGRAQFSSNGNATLTLDVNDGGTLNLGQLITDTATIASNGRATMPVVGAVLYLIDTSSAFLMSPDGNFGFVEQQTGGPFNNASASGQFFFGGGAPVPAGDFDSGVTVFDGVNQVTLAHDSSSEGGLGTETLGLSYSITPAGKITFTFPGEGNVTTGYVISGSKAVFMSTDPGPTSPELFVGQK